MDALLLAWCQAAQAAMDAPLGLSVCRYVLGRNTEAVGGSKHDAVHGWPIVSPHRHVQLISLFDG